MHPACRRRALFGHHIIAAVETVAQRDAGGARGPWQIAPKRASFRWSPLVAVKEMPCR